MILATLIGMLLHFKLSELRIGQVFVFDEPVRLLFYKEKIGEVYFRV
jgi:hypothetical protein